MKEILRLLKFLAGNSSSLLHRSVESVVLCYGSSATQGKEKTIDSPYLTVEQVRMAANAWLTAQGLGPSARQVLYRRVADDIQYHQWRNRQARKSHRKKTLHRLRQVGIKVALRSVNSVPVSLLTCDQHAL